MRWREFEKDLTADAERWRAAAQKLALGVVGKSNLLGNGQFAVARLGIDRFLERNTFELEVLSRAPQRTLLAHHTGHAVGLLACGPLLFARLLPVLQAVQSLVQLFTYALVQWVTQ